MRHEQVHAKDSYHKVDVAAVWPAAPQVAPLPIPDVEQRLDVECFRSEASAPDVPVGVGMLIVASYAGLIAAFAFVSVGSRESIFMIVIAGLFLVAFFTVPRIFLRVEPKIGTRPTFDRFLSDGIVTLTGHSSGKDALVQMLIVPVFLTIGALAMGLTAAFIF